jgi:hypothetical protein
VQEEANRALHALLAQATAERNQVVVVHPDQVAWLQ